MLRISGGFASDLPGFRDCGRATPTRIRRHANGQEIDAELDLQQLVLSRTIIKPNQRHFCNGKGLIEKSIQFSKAIYTVLTQSREGLLTFN
jgi:hypothetical protein